VDQVSPQGRYPIPGSRTFERGKLLRHCAQPRVVTASPMTFADKRISASLVTIELLPTDKGDRSDLHHQGAFFEGADGRQMREAGWRKLFDQLATELAGHRSSHE